MDEDEEMYDNNNQINIIELGDVQESKTFVKASMSDWQLHTHNNIAKKLEQTNKDQQKIDAERKKIEAARKETLASIEASKRDT